MSTSQWRSEKIVNPTRHTMPLGAVPRRHFDLFLSVVLLLLNFSDARVVGGELPRTNLAVYQSLARDLAVKMGEKIRPGDSLAIDLVVRPAEQAWIVEGALTDGLRSTGKKVVAQDGDISAECSVSTMTVMYEEGRKVSLFGERVVDRVVDLRIRALIADRRSGQIYSSAEFGGAARDTIPVSAIPRLEDVSVPVTRGEVPTEGFFSWFAEPFIVIGAVAVSVLLLFHVRS